jgi:PAS domain S-box-containing protein
MHVDDGPTTVLYVAPDANADPEPPPVTALEGVDGVAAVTAANADAALATRTERDVDCVVSEQSLPEDSGLELLAAVRDDDPILPTVLYPADGSEVLASRATRNGVTEYLPKPSGSDGHETLVDRVLDAVDDASRRRERVSELRDLRQFKTAMFESDIWINLLDRFGTVTEVNQGVVEITGYSAAEIVGNENAWELLYPDDEYREEVLTVAEEILRGEREVEDFETTIRTADGDERIVSWYSYPITDPNGELSGSVAVGRDITEREEREQRLREMNTRLELALEETDTGVWEWDVDTDAVFWDEACERLYGYDPGEFPGTFDAFADRVVDADFETVEEEISTAFETGEQYRTDFRIELPDGTRRWIQARGVVKYDDGAPTRVIGIQTDITERKERERELETTKRKLEDTNRTLELLNHIIRHDIRTETDLLLGRLRQLRATGSDADAGTLEFGRKERRALDDIERSGEFISELTERTRELMDAVTTTPQEVEPVPLAPAVHRVVGKLDDAGDATITVDGEVPDVDVYANEMLGTVFRNLLTNAIQHNDAEHPAVTVSASREDGYVTVAVADNGPGIPAGKREEVFGRGTRLEGSDGTGFGLFLVETLVDQYGGEIRVEDNEPTGAVFEVTLPTVEG